MDKECFKYLNLSEMNYLKLVIQCKDRDELLAVEQSINEQIENYQDKNVSSLKYINTVCVVDSYYFKNIDNGFLNRECKKCYDVLSEGFNVYVFVFNRLRCEFRLSLNIPLTVNNVYSNIRDNLKIAILSGCNMEIERIKSIFLEQLQDKDYFEDFSVSVSDSNTLQYDDSIYNTLKFGYNVYLWVINQESEDQKELTVNIPINFNN